MHCPEGVEASRHRALIPRDCLTVAGGRMFASQRMRKANCTS